jgi:hypothetical protein
MPDRCDHSVALDSQCSDSYPSRSDRHYDSSRVCLNPCGLLPPRRPVYWPKNSGAALELGFRNERNQLGPLGKSVASSWNCKIGFEIGSCKSLKEIDVVRAKAARLAISVGALAGLAEIQESGSPGGKTRSGRGLGQAAIRDRARAGNAERPRPIFPESNASLRPPPKLGSSVRSSLNPALTLQVRVARCREQ